MKSFMRYGAILYGITIPWLAAKQVQTHFTITAEIVNGCRFMNAPILDFGDITITDNHQQAQASTLIKVICTPGTQASLTIDGGLHSQLYRQLADKNNQHFIHYTLTDKDHIPWQINQEKPIDSMAGKESDTLIYASLTTDNIDQVYPGEYGDQLTITANY